MSIGPDKVATTFDLFRVNGVAGFGTQTGTRAYDTFILPPGKKSVQISVVTSATVTLNIQNSNDGANWFNLLISTQSSVIVEVDTMIPRWRLNVTSHSTSGTGSAAVMVANIAQLV